MNAVVREMLVLVRSQASEHAVCLRTQDLAATADYKVTADRVQLQQVLMNLMLNGIEAMSGSGEN